MRKLFTIIGLFIGVGQIYAQQPVISNIDPVSGYPSSRVAISGSGFGTDPADLVVWFGTVEATITAVDDNLILVEVPPQASADNITVVQLSSGLAVQSDEKFYPVYSGNGFDPAKVAIDHVTSSDHVYDPCSCDFDGDGKPDVVATKFETATGGEATNLVVLHNQSTIGSLSFVESALLIGNSTVNLRCGDLSGDGKPDLYMSRGGQNRFNILVFENTSVPGNISFADMLTLHMNTSVTSRRVSHKDLDGDGKPEIVVSNSFRSSAGEVIVFKNTSSGSLSFASPMTINIPGSESTTGLELQDVDGDGKPDIIVGQFMDNNVFVLRNTSAGSISFASPTVLTLIGNSLLNLTSGDFNGNGKLDIAVVGNSGDRVFVFPNQSTPGNVSFGSPEGFSVNDGPWGITTGDVNGDGLLDIISTSIGQNNLTVLINESSGGSLSFVNNPIAIGKRSRNVVVTDLDGDAKPDFVATTYVSPKTDFAVSLIRNENCYQPAILNEGPLKICPGQTITLSTPPSPAVTFSWTKDGVAFGGNNNTLDVTDPGTYMVTATSESGSCSLTASINVASGTGAIPGAPTATNPGPACLGGDLTLSVDPVADATYQWTGPNNFSSTDREPVISNITNDDAGIYSVYITSSGGCQSSVSETTVEVVNLPVFNAVAAGPREVCAGNTVQLNTEFRSGYDYQWLKDGVEVTGALSNSYLATQSGTYRVRIDDTGSSCQAITNEVEVNVYAAPQADFDKPASGCVGDEVLFADASVIDAAAPVTYHWNFGNGDTSTEQNPGYSYNAAGAKTVRLDVVYTGVGGCADSAVKGININTPVVPVIESAATAICSGQELELSIAGTFNSITWNTSETTSSITVTEPGTYSVTVVDANGCDAYAEVAIAPLAPPQVRATVIPNPADSVISAGNDVQLEATGADTYSWSPAGSLSDATVANPIASPEKTTIYTVTGTTRDGCSSTDQLTIVVTQGGEADITPLKAFSPNSTINPTWYIENVLEYPDCTLSIFNEKGSLVYRKKGYTNDWDATYNGGNLPEGIYYYVFGCEGLAPKTGSVLVVR